MYTETKWKLLRRSGRKYWVCRYLLPGSNQWREESTRKTRKRQAESVAKAIIAAAQEQGDREVRGWAEFRARYETEHLSGAPLKTLQAFQTAANRLETLCKPETINDLDADMLSRFALRLRKEKLSPASIQAYRDHLMSALKWAVRVNVIAKRPDPPPLPSSLATKKTRGRPLTRKELELMALKLPMVVPKEHAARWAWNLEGLWRSGFRLGETFVFYWEPTEGMHFIENLDGDRPRIIIDESGEKGHQNRTIPMAPDFAAMLRAVDPKDRRGLVFRWPLQSCETRNVKTVGKRISQLGQLSGVVTGTRMKRLRGQEPETAKQYATAHDIRKAYGARWAPKVMPVVLKVMMRHQSIETTLKYYVGLNADRTGDALWRVQGATLGDMLDSLIPPDEDENSESP